MGSLEPNKNFKWIAETARQMPDQIFAIAGSINEQVFSDNLGFQCPSNMKLLGFVSDSEAKTLMRDCKAFLFPSIYEGFGIPPLEAMSAGCKCIIVSNTEVMHEILFDAVNYINHLKNGYIENLNVINNKFGILDRYSWHISSLKLFDLLKEMENGNK